MAWADIVRPRDLRPHLLGLELEPFPYPSALSVLFRVTRLMALEPCEWLRTVGLRFTSNVSATVLDLRRSRVARARFEAAVGVANTQVPTWWAQEAWSPLATGGLLDREVRPTRWCWHCANYGYHTALFQLPSIQSCPWHDYPLLDRCPRCRKPGSGVIDSLGQIGRCDCGFDWLVMNTATVNMWSFPTERAETWLSAYLGWAQEQRERRRLVAPPSRGWIEGYSILAEPPPELQSKLYRPWVTGSSTEVFDEGGAAEPPTSDFWGWGALGDAQPLTYVPLPEKTLDILADVTQRVVQGLPVNITSPVALAACPDPDARAALNETIADRPRAFIAPHSRARDGTTWMNVSAVDLHTLQACGGLIDQTIHLCDPEPSDILCSRQAARSAAAGRITGRWRLAGALERILAVGYRQGLDALLRSSLELPPPSAWQIPVAEVEGEPGALCRVRVCWIPADVPRLRRSEPRVAPRAASPKSWPGKRSRKRRGRRQTLARRKPNGRQGRPGK